MKSRLNKKWNIYQESDKEAVIKFSQQTNIPYSLSKILLERGINSKEEAKRFFIPELSHLHDPFLMKDMEKASQRIIKALRENEPILIFGDYDVDGTSGVAMFRLFLNKLGIQNDIYIPDRFTEGYGLSINGIDYAINNNIKLIIAIDCGITALDKVKYANKNKIEVIICDHHQPPDILPDAFAILDPLQKDCDYPFKSLCGTGVAFKLIHAISSLLNIDTHYELIDFPAISTAADMVPVLDENRVLLYFGFKNIINEPRPSLEALIKNSGFKVEHLRTSNVVFNLGPRINAVGRLGDGTRAVNFMTCETISEAESLASILESENINRKKIDTEVFIQAQQNYEDYIKTTGNNDVTIVLHNQDWHPGVLGIIASRMVERYYRPAIILTTFNGYAKGSARSINNFNIYDALRRTADECDGLIQFGGHYHAAGVEVDINKIDDFRRKFNHIAQEIINESEFKETILIPEIKINSEIQLSEIDERYIKILRHFEPFGPGNMTPVFITYNLQIIGEPKIYHNSTYVFKVRKADSNKKYNEQVFDCIYFETPGINKTPLNLNTGYLIDIVYSIDENHWNGKSKTQLRVKDMIIKQKDN